MSDPEADDDESEGMDVVICTTFTSPGWLLEFGSEPIAAPELEDAIWIPATGNPSA